jgi:hypothetical protein
MIAAPEPCPQIGEIAKNEITEGCRSDQLDIAEQRDDRGWAALKGANDQVMSGTAEQAEAGEQQQIEEVLRRHNDERQHKAHHQRADKGGKDDPGAAGSKAAAQRVAI